MKNFNPDPLDRIQFVSRILVLLGVFVLNFQVLFPYTGIHILAYFWDMSAESMFNIVLGPPNKELILIKIIFNAWVNMGGFAVTAWVYFKLKEQSFLPQSILAGAPFKIKTLGYALLVFGCALILNNIAGFINALIPYPTLWGMDAFLKGLDDKIRIATSYILMMPNLSSFMINLFLVAVVPAVSEELFFRGALQNLLMSKSGKPLGAIVVTSLLFALIHLKFSHFIPIFTMSMVLGYVYYYTQNLLYVMVLHFINNGLILFLYYYFPSLTDSFMLQESAMPPWYFIFIAFAGFLWAFFRLKKQFATTISKIKQHE